MKQLKKKKKDRTLLQKPNKKTFITGNKKILFHFFYITFYIRLFLIQVMTTFYSTKVNKEVSIPNDKVCGYRFKNGATKTGWSSGVRSGKDNGVVNQKFSRFSTDTETNSKGPCAGNTNWINHKTGDGFTKPESAYTQFEIKRPSFISGQSYVQHQE